LCKKATYRACRAHEWTGCSYHIDNTLLFCEFNLDNRSPMAAKKTIKENPVTYLQIALADKKPFWYFPA
jgi:hypothetical protein